MLDIMSYILGKQSAEGGGGGETVDWDGFAAGTWPSGEAVLSNSVTDIASYAFAHDGAITSISGPEVLTINENNIFDCSNLTSVYLPKVTRIGRATAGNTAGVVLTRCYALRTLHLPELLEANGTGNFQSLGQTNEPITIVLPKITAIGGSNLRDLKAEAVDIGPNLATLNGYNFYSSYGYYNNIILRKTDDVVAAPSSNCISGIRATTKVWVPEDLIDDYKAASNWSALGDVFYAIEGSIYEHAYADGTPIPTT
jgi:hypothetical protein